MRDKVGGGEVGDWVCLFIYFIQTLLFVWKSFIRRRCLFLYCLHRKRCFPLTHITLPNSPKPPQTPTSPSKEMKRKQSAYALTAMLEQESKVILAEEEGEEEGDCMSFLLDTQRNNVLQVHMPYWVKSR